MGTFLGGNDMSKKILMLVGDYVEDYEAMVIPLTVGQELSREQLLARLVDLHQGHAVDRSMFVRRARASSANLSR